MNRLEDTDTIKNAFEVSGPLIERITAVCQESNEANKWVDLLSPEGSTSSAKSKSNEGLRNMSNSAVNLPPTPSHVSSEILSLFPTSFSLTHTHSHYVYGFRIVRDKRANRIRLPKLHNELKFGIKFSHRNQPYSTIVVIVRACHFARIVSVHQTTQLPFHQKHIRRPRHTRAYRLISRI